MVCVPAEWNIVEGVDQYERCRRTELNWSRREREIERFRTKGVTHRFHLHFLSISQLLDDRYKRRFEDNWQLLLEGDELVAKLPVGNRIID